MTVVPVRPRPPQWEVLRQAIAERKTLKARYHGRDRLLCPHLLGWRNGRAKLLSYQASPATTEHQLAANPRHRWRSMFVDELDELAITDDPWLTATNYTANAAGIDIVEVAVQL